MIFVAVKFCGIQIWFIQNICLLKYISVGGAIRCCKLCYFSPRFLTSNWMLALEVELNLLSFWNIVSHFSESILDCSYTDLSFQLRHMTLCLLYVVDGVFHSRIDNTIRWRLYNSFTIFDKIAWLKLASYVDKNV